MEHPRPILGRSVPVVAPVEPVHTEPRRSGGGLGTIIAAAVLSAVLASGGTVLLLKTTGALDRGAGASALAASTQGPVSIDESSAVVDAAAHVSPAVVRITASGCPRTCSAACCRRPASGRA